LWRRDPVKAHGTVLLCNGVSMGELKDITPPPMGVRRAGEIQMRVNWLPTEDE
jgi:hypothetical protein